jgi:hypothetical protein
MHRIELLADVGHVESRFGPFGDSVSVGSLLMWVMWNLVLVRLGTVLVLVEDRSTVCAKCTIG